MAALATDTFAITCGRCDGTGRYHGRGVCYGCGGGRLVTITVGAWRAMQAERRAWNASAAAARTRRAEILASLDWTGATPCTYGDRNCERGACSACLGGRVPDRARNPQLADLAA